MQQCACTLHARPDDCSRHATPRHDKVSSLNASWHDRDIAHDRPQLDVTHTERGALLLGTWPHS